MSWLLTALALLLDNAHNVQDLANLEVLEVGPGNTEQTLVDLHTQVIVKNLCDSVPKLVYNQLISMVSPKGHSSSHTSSYFLT